MNVLQGDGAEGELFGKQVLSQIFAKLRGSSCHRNEQHDLNQSTQK